MQIRKIKNRGVLFTQNAPGWDLNLYLITGKNCNYIIDTGLGSSDIEEVKEIILNDGKQIIVINTHYHWDHVWGNSAAGACAIVSHKLCREMIVANWEGMMQRNSRFCRGDVQMRLPNLVFDREIHFADDGIRLLYTPGHTIDSISILDEEEGVLMAGDNIGDTMEELIPSLACDKSVYAETLRQYLQLDFDTCVSGHNEVLKKDVIHQILGML